MDIHLQPLPPTMSKLSTPALTMRMHHHHDAVTKGLSLPTCPNAVHLLNARELVSDVTEHMYCSSLSNPKPTFLGHPAAAHYTKPRHANISMTDFCEHCRNNRFNTSTRATRPHSPATTDSADGSISYTLTYRDEKDVEIIKPSRGCLPSLSGFIKSTFPAAAINLADRSKIKTSTVQAVKPGFDHRFTMDREMDSLNIHVRERQHWYHNLYYEHASSGKVRLGGTHGAGMGRAVGCALM